MQVWLLLERNGSHLIDVGENGLDFAKENDLAEAPVFETVGDLQYLAVDALRPGLSSFYSWSDVAPGTIPSKELWRPFIWLKGTNHLLAGTPLSTTHTAQSVLEPILSLRHI